ncbi:Lysozyme [Frankliniella occidentalis]|nr:Lysozyme [Frankliniella occidentalis]
MRTAVSLTRALPSPALSAVAAVLALLALLQAADAKVYGRCELASALKSKGIASKLSSIDTDTATDPDDDVDGTVYHGVFLISDKWWCDRGKAGCGVTCAQMKKTLESNIDCAKKVFSETKRSKKNGFKAWGAYEDCLEPESYVRGCAGLEEEDEDITVWQRSGFKGAGSGSAPSDGAADE